MLGSDQANNATPASQLCPNIKAPYSIAHLIIMALSIYNGVFNHTICTIVGKHRISSGSGFKLYNFMYLTPHVAIIYFSFN